MEKPEQGELEALYQLDQRQFESLQSQELARRHELMTAACTALERNESDPQAYIDVANLHQKLHDLEEAVSVLRKGVRLCVGVRSLWERLIEILESGNRTAEAIDAAHRAAVMFPDELFWKLKERLLLPVVYETSREIDACRERYSRGLDALTRELLLEAPETRHDALSAVGKHVNFYLGYQARDDRGLQTCYGELLHRIMAANYPDWAQTRTMPPRSDGEKLRIGYVSDRFRNVSVTKNHLEWIRQHDRGRFSVFTYYVGKVSDGVTQQVKLNSRSFYHYPNSFEDTAKAIAADRLHILLYLDIGMSPVMSQLAALRLAPIQCMTWAVPITSGLPTMDYFISASLMEPDGAESHYSEKLVCLPGVGVCHRKPVIPRILLNKSRTAFGIREDSVVYLSCQSVFKYLPAQDSMFAQIARRVPHAQFVFVHDQRGRVDFQKRLERAFAAAGLNTDGRCVWLPEQSLFDYWNLNLISDVFLDTVGWSGGVTSFEAVACALPIVTLPGALMRGRHTYAILTQLGVTETIARDEGAYVEIAVRLGQDPTWRETVVQSMVRAYPRLFWDNSSVPALERFFQQAVQEQTVSPC